MSSPIFQQFNNEINEFYKYLKANNYTDDEIRKIFEPIYIKSKKNFKRFLSICLLSIILVIFVYLLLWSSETISWHLSAIMRIFMIKLLPYWNWTVLKNQECLIKDSPLRLFSIRFDDYDDNTKIDNCDLCENLAMIDVYRTIDSDRLENRYINLDIPVIITNNSINISDTKSIIDQILSDQILIESYPCNLRTNLGKNPITIGELLQSTQLFDSFFVHFQNCDYETMKYFRKFFIKPKYLPLNLSPIQYNWLLWNFNYNTTIFKTIDLLESVMVYGQLYGESILRLSPRFDCDLICEQFDIVLESGEILIFTNLWNFEYKPNGNESLAIMLEMH